MVIPVEERFPNLKEFLVDQLVRLLVAQAAEPNFAPVEQSRLFTHLVFPWLLEDEELSEAEQKEVAQRRTKFIGLGFDGARAKATLKAIHEGDQHLRQCCPTNYQLSIHLDDHFFAPAVAAMWKKVDPKMIESQYGAFEQLTYEQGRFRRFSLSHLFNFEMDDDAMTIAGHDEALSIRIKRLSAHSIPTPLGESAFRTFVHPPGVGECFVVEEDNSLALSDADWLEQSRHKALYFARVLNYFQDGLVHLGYTVAVFFPRWAGPLRQPSSLFLGEMRRATYDSGNSPYRIRRGEIERLTSWWKAATSPWVLGKIEEQKGDLRQAIWRAGDYYESSHVRTDAADRLIAIAIGFEALFSPDSKIELSFRISQTAAQLLGRSAEERQDVFGRLKKMYKQRSEVAHGSYNLKKQLDGTLVLNEELAGWAELLRKSLIAFLAFYLGGENKRKEVLRRIEELNFDDTKRKALWESSDLDAVLAKVPIE